jgi:hypothetical protein
LGAAHQLIAQGAGNIATIGECLITRDGNGRAENGGLIFAVGADLLKRRRIHPNAAAFFAVAEVDVVEREIGEGDAAVRAIEFGRSGRRCGGEGVAAVRAESGAEESEAEAVGAGDGGEARAAIGAGGGVGRQCSAAGGAVEGGSGHGSRIIAWMGGGKENNEGRLE